MKIGFPLLNETELAHDFAHSTILGIIDLNTGQRSFLPVKEETGSEKNIFESLVNSGLNNVISPFYTFMSLRVFKENKITTYKAKGNTLDINLTQFISGKMQPFDIYEALLTGECAKDCLGCSPEEACETHD